MRFSNIIFRTLSSGFCHPEERSDEGSGSGSVILSTAKDLFMNLVILSAAKNLSFGSVILSIAKDLFLVLTIFSYFTNCIINICSTILTSQ